MEKMKKKERKFQVFLIKNVYDRYIELFYSFLKSRSIDSRYYHNNNNNHKMLWIGYKLDLV